MPRPKKQTIDYSVFTEEEVEKLKRLEDGNLFDFVTDVIDEMTPEKEVELQKLRDMNRGIDASFESQVLREYEKAHPYGPQTPEEEAELQVLLDKERAEHEKTLQQKAKDFFPEEEENVETKKEEKVNV